MILPLGRAYYDRIRANGWPGEVSSPPLPHAPSGTHAPARLPCRFASLLTRRDGSRQPPSVPAPVPPAPPPLSALGAVGEIREHSSPVPPYPHGRQCPQIEIQIRWAARTRSPPTTMAVVVLALFLLGIKDRVLIWRDYRGDVSAIQAERFFTELLDKDSDSEVHSPMIYDDASGTYMFIQHNIVFLLTAASQNCNAATILLLLHRVIDHYFEELEEESF